jgi:hypothetical protein
MVAAHSHGDTGRALLALSSYFGHVTWASTVLVLWLAFLAVKLSFQLVANRESRLRKRARVAEYKKRVDGDDAGTALAPTGALSVAQKEYDLAKASCVQWELEHMCTYTAYFWRFATVGSTGFVAMFTVELVIIAYVEGLFDILWSLAFLTIFGMVLVLSWYLGLFFLRIGAFCVGWFIRHVRAAAQPAVDEVDQALEAGLQSPRGSFVDTLEARRRRDPRLRDRRGKAPRRNAVSRVAPESGAPSARDAAIALAKSKNHQCNVGKRDSLTGARYCQSCLAKFAPKPSTFQVVINQEGPELPTPSDLNERPLVEREETLEFLKCFTETVVLATMLDHMEDSTRHRDEILELIERMRDISVGEFHPELESLAQHVQGGASGRQVLLCLEAIRSKRKRKLNKKQHVTDRGYVGGYEGDAKDRELMGAGRIDGDVNPYEEEEGDTTIYSDDSYQPPPRFIIRAKGRGMNYESREELAEAVKLEAHQPGSPTLSERDEMRVLKLVGVPGNGSAPVVTGGMIAVRATRPTESGGMQGKRYFIAKMHQLGKGGVQYERFFAEDRYGYRVALIKRADYPYVDHYIKRLPLEDTVVFEEEKFASAPKGWFFTEKEIVDPPVGEYPAILVGYDDVDGVMQQKKSSGVSWFMDNGTVVHNCNSTFCWSGGVGFVNYNGQTRPGFNHNGAIGEENFGLPLFKQIPADSVWPSKEQLTEQKNSRVVPAKQAPNGESSSSTSAPKIRAARTPSGAE